MRAVVLGLAACVSLVLAACQRGADTGATANPNAPGSPGTGNAPVVAQPTAPDSGGGSSPSGATGGGGTSAQPGTGLQGGLGASGGQPTPPAEGSTNRTTQGSVGNR